jgi:hypothetical protein
MRVTRLPLAVVATTLCVLSFGGTPSAAPPTSTTTAQSIMIDATGTPSTLAIVQTHIYKFNIDTAATFFTNQWDGNLPVVSCTGNPTACSNPAPAAPAAPAPLASAVIGGGTFGNIGHDGIVGDNRCAFLDGGLLTGASYTQDVKVEVGSTSSKRTYTYTFTYAVAPNTDSVGPLTAWDLVQTNGDGTAHVDVVALIAGESVSVSKNLGTKYSFSLLQGDGVSVRVSNVGVSVDGGPADTSGILTYTDRGLEPTLDYLYAGNAFVNGAASASLIDNAYASDVLKGAINGGVGPDTFPGNDNGGANGQALAAVRLSGVGVDLAPGPHAVTISATVKDNNGALLGTVSVNLNINVVTPGCGGN